MSAQKLLSVNAQEPGGLEWVRLKEELREYETESRGEKFKKKLFENPLVPIGALGTTAALTYGLIQFKKGNKFKQQQMMRLRVSAQGFTVMVAVVGLAISGLLSSGGTKEN